MIQRKKIISEETIARIKELRDNGATLASIAEECGVSVSSVHCILNPEKKKKYNEKVKQLFRERKGCFADWNSKERGLYRSEWRRQKKARLREELSKKPCEDAMMIFDQTELKWYVAIKKGDKLERVSGYYNYHGHANQWAIRNKYNIINSITTKS